jgi:hypothetical protein
MPMTYRVLMWTLAALLLVAGVTAFDLYRERRDEGPIFVANNGPVSEDQVRQKMTADGWTNVLITREGRYFQVMGSKDQQTSHFAINSQTGRLRGGEDDD